MSPSEKTVLLAPAFSKINRIEQKVKKKKLWRNYFILQKNSHLEGFEHDDFGIIHSPDLCFVVGNQVETHMKSQAGNKKKPPVLLTTFKLSDVEKRIELGRSYSFDNSSSRSALSCARFESFFDFIRLRRSIKLTVSLPYGP